jgi:hypothetical protein
MRNLVLVAAALLTLPACRPAGDAAKSGEALAEDGVPVDGPSGKSGDPVAGEAKRTAVPSNEFLENVTGGTPSPAPLPTMIPQQFHGRWALTEADCRGGAAAKGLLTIDDSRLTFYESKGTLDRIVSNSPHNVLVANYGLSGEGLAWERLVRLERSGPKLRRSEEGSEEGPVDLTYTACPG